MDGISFIQDLAIVLLGAGIAGVLCKRIGLSVIVGYLVAGIIIGPHTPPFSYVRDIERIQTLSQLGLVFLMFGIGLGLSLTRLQKMGLSTLVATGLGAFLVLNLTQLLGKVAGWEAEKSLFVAAMFMVSSSAVIAKIIKELNLLHERSGQLALGVTVLEDIVAVVMLAVLGAQVASAEAGSPAIGTLLVGLLAFVVLLGITCLLIIPRLLQRLDGKADPELQTIIVAGVLFFVALTAVKSGYSLALGAFLLGAIVAEMPQRGGVEKSFAGMRDIFSSVFFVSIGMMIEVKLMLGVWFWILALTVFTMAARALSTGLALMVVGTPPREARRAGLALMPLGEFTFVIAGLGVGAQVLPPEFYSVAVGVSILTVLLTPLINRWAEPLLVKIERAEPRLFHRALAIYHNWLAQLACAHAGRVWWQLSKKRLAQVALEMLFITGLLIFSERLLGAFLQSPLAVTWRPETAGLLFWAAIGIMVLFPLIAIWRNLAATAMIFAELATKRSRVPGPLVENCLKGLNAVGLGYWLAYILPYESLPRWAWIVIAVVLVLIFCIFYRRLIKLHSRWQSDLRDVFAEVKHLEASPATPWLEKTGSWGLSVQEFLVPARAACVGRSIADLRVRSEFGCTIVEIDRQGYAIIAPESTQAIYPGDRLLLLGRPEQIAAARTGLGQLQEAEGFSNFDQARLERIVVPPGPHQGGSLADLQIRRQTGVLVVGIERSGERIENPEGGQIIDEGDELLVLGTPEQVRHFKRWFTDFQWPQATQGG
ncbi:hypothetical protein DESUT3_26830 [Desulfuromonas versatilis]|uniref:RCK C-terminal domain-containing protein n=2 Tax=Desulfuromonas versatilis TaxID=2802975 RepID=A0ABN6E270_9BACT|nr:hypothetical protein DESUT3_26830 [Desulfuromonas versatilis]